VVARCNSASHRPPAGNKIEDDALVRKDHGAVEDAVVPGRDAAFSVQMRQGFHADRDVGIADVDGDREAPLGCGEGR
jgi:hypothetical protein